MPITKKEFEQGELLWWRRLWRWVKNWLEAICEPRQNNPKEGGMMSKQDSMLLTDEEFVDAQVDYIKKNQEATGITWHFPLQGELRDDCNRKAQLAKALPIIEKQERERIIKVLTKEGLFDDFLCSEEKALKNNCPTCKMFWQALKGAPDED